MSKVEIGSTWKPRNVPGDGHRRELRAIYRVMSRRRDGLYRCTSLLPSGEPSRHRALFDGEYLRKFYEPAS